jgi:thiamine-monophosphate kinase
MVSLQTVGQLGENESLRRTVARLSQSEHAIVGSGDDAAVVATTDDRFVVTTDTMIEGHDFRLDWSNFYDLGFKAIATNLSDVAAMGAKPTALVVAIAVPPTTLIEQLEAFADGLRDGCQQLAPGCGVVGGDLASSEQVFISVTAHGALEGRESVLRSGAKPGDIVAIAGTLGRAAAGLALLESGNADAISAYDDWVAVQRRPRPPIAAGISAAVAGATSMLDVSDGLAKDADRIAKASGVAVRLNRRDLDGFIAMVEEPAMALGVDASAWVLFGGEDHGLLATFGPEAKLPREFKPIGVVGQGEGVWLDDKPLPENGWDSITGA